jgi:hypothetical protein
MASTYGTEAGGAFALPNHPRIEVKHYDSMR